MGRLACVAAFDSDKIVIDHDMNHAFGEKVEG